MNKIARVAAVIILAALICSEAAYSYDTSAGSMASNKSIAIDVGNKFCPVMGEKVDGKSFYEYNGKHYGLCCPICVGTFRNDPVKYSGIAEKEVSSR